MNSALSLLHFAAWSTVVVTSHDGVMSGINFGLDGLVVRVGKPPDKSSLYYH